jgi:hypothetical protein
MIRRLSMTRIYSQSTTESWVKPPMPAGTNTWEGKSARRIFVVNGAMYVD